MDAPRTQRAAPDWLVHRVSPRLAPLWRRGFRFVFLLDAMGLYGSMVAINTIRFGTAWPTYPLSHYIVGFTIATVIHLVIGYLSGLYEREPRLGSRPWLPRVAVATGIGIAVQGVAFVVLDRYLMPRLNLVALGVVGTLVITTNRQISRRLTLWYRGPSRVALIGPADAITAARTQLKRSDRTAVVVAEAATIDGLFERVRSSQATDVLLLDVDAFGRIFPEPLGVCEAAGVGFLQRVGATETLLGLTAVREVAGMPFVRLRSHTLSSHQVRLKRAMDLLLLLATAPVSVPVLAMLALYVRVRAGTPVLYRQTRVGRDGQLFTLIKFRTMVRDAESTGAVLASAGDPRVVAGLGWMRSTRADELPQLWNVTRGEMSLVGPRPERPEFTAQLAKRIPGYERRHELAPGLTGLAQVNGRYDTDAAFKLGHDLQYLVNWSPVLDVQILVRTVWVVAARRV